MAKPYVYITRKLPTELVGPLNEIAEIKMWEEEDAPVPVDILYEEAKRATALLTMLTDPITADLLKDAPHLKIVSNMAVGYDNIDVSAANHQGVIIGHTPDILTDTTADLTFTLLLAAARRIVEAAALIKDDRWQQWAPFFMAGGDVHHKTIGIVGMGRIGQAVAKRAAGFDMKILYHNRSRNTQAEQELGAIYCEFDDLLQQADFVVALTPLTEETKGMFNAAAFQKMKANAYFINAARGAVMDEKALYEALINQEIAGAGLDVFENEPISSHHPLLKLSNVVALPHIGSATIATRQLMVKRAVANITAVLQGTNDIKAVKIHQSNK